MDKNNSEQGLFQKLIYHLLLFLPYLLSLILFCLCLFCKPSAEDLAIHYFSSTQGILGFIKTFYLQEGSRYFSFPLVTIICHSRFMLEHYWIIPLVLMGLTWMILRLGVNFLLPFLDLTIARRWISWISVILFLTYCSVIFEMSSFFYWMSGSITYLPSFLLSILLVMVLGKNRMGKPSPFNFFIALLLVVCIAGTNEIALYFLIIFLVWLQLLYYSTKRQFSGILILCLTASLLCLLFLILPSGIAHRAGNYKMNFPVLQAFGVALGYTARILFRAITQPFAWITVVMAVLAGFFTKESIKEKLTGRILFSPQLILPALCVAIGFFYFMIYLFSGELLAPRAHNLMMAYSFSGLLVCSYAFGISWKVSKSFLEKLYPSRSLQFILLVLIVSSLFMRETIYNALTGIIYNRVMKERTVQIKAALRNDRHSVLLHPYAEDFAIQGEKMLPSFVHHVLRKKLMNYPDWMHFQDPLQDTALYIHYYAEFHHIDTVWYLGTDYERIGLLRNENQKP